MYAAPDRFELHLSARGSGFLPGMAPDLTHG